MQVHRRWLKLALVTIALKFQLADAQVYTMRSNLDEDSESSSDHERTPTPTAKKPMRMWIPITNPPSYSLQTNETPSRSTAATLMKPPRTATLTEPKRTPQPATKAPRAPPATSDNSFTSRYQELVNLESPSESENADLSSGLENPLESTAALEEPEEETEALDELRPKTKKQSKITFTKSPYLLQTTPMPNSIHTTDDDDLNSDESGSLPSKTESKPTEPKTKKKSSDSTSGSDSVSQSTPSSKSSSGTVSPSVESSLDSVSPSTPSSKSSKLTEQDSIESPKPSLSGHLDSDAAKGALTTKPPVSSTTSSSASGSSSSAASVLADEASADKTGVPNTLMLGLMMGGAVALVMLVAVFVYVKTKEKDDEEDPVLRTVRHGGNKETAQLSTVATNFHENNNMSPMEYHDDNYYPNIQHQYDQDAYGFHHGQGNSANCAGSNFDALTPQSQIALAHSQMSLPPMAQSDHSNGSSQYSNFTTQSDFYGNSAYSANSSSESQVANNYPGMRKGKRENDIAGSGDESDYEGDTTADMSQATNKWNAAGRNRGGAAASGIDRSMLESQFDPGDSRSTSASDYTGKNRYKESEYTEYRMSTGYDNSHVGGGQGYDNSFASSKSGYDNSFAASKSGYDQSFAASKSGYDSCGKSFASSGFSEYDNAPRNRNSDSSSFYRKKA